jgi:hypothetical protein
MLLMALGAATAHCESVSPLTSSQKFRLAKEHNARVHQAVSRNLILPDGLPPGARCRIQIVQEPSGAVEAVEIEECYSTAFEKSVLEAIARTSLPLPLQFPEDPPLVRSTVWLEFSLQDSTVPSNPLMQPTGQERPATD